MEVIDYSSDSPVRGYIGIRPVNSEGREAYYMLIDGIERMVSQEYNMNETKMYVFDINFTWSKASFLT